LPVRRKVAYGAGDSGFSLTSIALALLYLFFLVNVVGLDLAGWFFARHWTHLRCSQ
jgi:Na+/melibiose symporter-like transporter